MNRSFLPVSILAFASASLAQWNQATPATSPAGRIEPSLAYDSANGATIMFGGADVGGFPPQAFNQTWSWNGADWSQLSPANSPSGRYFAGMAYDALRGRIVLYGGLAPTFFGANYLDDTWEWDGTNWTQIATANTPGSLIGNPGVGEHAMAYDPIGNRMVMFGGDLFQGIAPSPVTLEYDGIDWTMITAAGAAPGPRSQASLCSAPTLGGVLLFGGTNFNNPPGPNGEITWNDLWVYTSGNDTWTQLTPVGAVPPPRAGASLLFDTNTGLYVMHGGYADSPTGAIPLADTWTFDGTSWTDVSVAAGSPTAPLVRFGSADGPNGCHVLFGGADSFFGAAQNTTWRYGPCAAASTYGVGCAGSNGVPVLAAANVPALGSVYQIDASNLEPSAVFAFIVTGFSDTTSSVGPLPFALSAIGMGANCFLLSSTDSNSLVGVNAGVGSYLLTIPSNVAFLGTRLFHQAGSIDAGAAGGFAVSNGVTSFIGN